MFKNAVRAARPAARAACAATKPSGSALRAFSTSVRVQSGGPPAPPLFGPGGKAGQVPTDIEQATGLERLQLLGDLEGIKTFDDESLDASRVGTLADPIKVYSLNDDRLVGCTGFPAESHEVTWFNLNKDTIARCVECGSVYSMDFHGEEHDDHHH